jgi:hypothetical protein
MEMKRQFSSNYYIQWSHSSSNHLFADHWGSFNMSKGVSICPNTVDRPSIDEVNLCYRSCVDGLVYIDRWSLAYVWTHLKKHEIQCPVFDGNTLIALSPEPQHLEI